MVEEIKVENIEEKVDEPIEPKEEIKEEVKTFTQDEMDKIIEKRLARASKKADEEKVEAEKLAKMSETERATAEFEKEKASFAEERKQYQKEKLELQVVKELSTKNLPTDFSKYLISEDAEGCMSNIKEFEVHWQQAIEKAVDAKLRGTTPKTGGGAVTGVTKEVFAGMSYKEKSSMYTENPTLYKELSK